MTRLSIFSRRSVAGNNRGLDVATTVQHVAQHVLQARQGSLSGDVVGGTNLFRRNESEGTTDGLGRMVKRRLQGDFRIVQAAGIKLHFGAARTAAQEIYRAPPANPSHGPLPRF